jgi:hypothetical protein
MEEWKRMVGQKYLVILRDSLTVPMGLVLPVYTSDHRPSAAYFEVVVSLKVPPSRLARRRPSIAQCSV